METISSWCALLINSQQTALHCQVENAAISCTLPRPCDMLAAPPHNGKERGTSLWL